MQEDVLMSIRPVPTKGTMVRDENFGALLVSGDKPIMALNEDALAVWKLCDGSRSVGEIKAIILEEYEASQLEHRLLELLTFCLSHHLLENRTAVGET